MCKSCPPLSSLRQTRPSHWFLAHLWLSVSLCPWSGSLSSVLTPCGFPCCLYLPSTGRLLSVLRLAWDWSPSQGSSSAWCRFHASPCTRVWSRMNTGRWACRLHESACHTQGSWSHLLSWANCICQCSRTFHLHKIWICQWFSDASSPHWKLPFGSSR